MFFLILFLASCGNGHKHNYQEKKIVTPVIPIKAKPKINVYIENSASMDGFVNKGNDFTTFVSNFLNDTYIKYTEDINLYYINSRIIPLGNDLNEFATRLNPSDFKKMGGNRGATKIYELLDTILKATNNNTISFFITDGIFSPGKGKDSQKYINDQYNGIKRIFSNFFKTNPNAAVVVYQFLSPFNGIFYNRHDKPIYKVEEVLPYYIWIIGNIENVKDLMENVPIERIASKGSYKIFTAEGRKKVNYAIKINTGKFDLDKSNPKNTIINLRKDGRNNKVTFAVDVDFSSYVLNNEYLLDKNNYSLNNNNYDFSIKKATKNPYGYTHTLVFSADKVYKGILTIKLNKTNLPSWIFEDNDDEGLMAIRGKTYGIKYQIQGVHEAFSANDESYTEITINIK